MVLNQILDWLNDYISEEANKIFSKNNNIFERRLFAD